jgi:hypothetical protein
MQTSFFYVFDVAARTARGTSAAVPAAGRALPPGGPLDDVVTLALHAFFPAPACHAPGTLPDPAIEMFLRFQSI